MIYVMLFLYVLFLCKRNTHLSMCLYQSREKEYFCYYRCELIETQINAAVWEPSGHLVLKRRKDYDEVTETSICQLLAEAMLLENQFQEVKKHTLSLVGQKFS